MLNNSAKIKENRITNYIILKIDVFLLIRYFCGYEEKKNEGLS